MRTMTVRRGVVAGLGAAAGALAAAAFVSTAPIASADPNTGDTGIDYTAMAAPAATYPYLTYENELYVYSGNSYTEYFTDYTGTGTPTMTMDTVTLPTGETEYGSSDTFSSDYITALNTGYDYSTGYNLYDLTTAAGTSDIFEPLTSSFGSF